MIRLLLLFPFLLGGCCELLHDSPQMISQCKASGWIWESSGNDDRQRAQAQQELDAERTARNSAAPQCERGNAHACLTVAVFDERHDGAVATIAHDYTIACRGDLAYGCYGAGRFAAPQNALTLFDRACALGESAGCRAAAQMRGPRLGPPGADL